MQWGYITIGRVKLPTEKVRNRWMVDGNVLSRAIEEHRAELTRLQNAADLYEQRVLNARDGETVRLPHGAYRVSGGFHFVWDDFSVALGQSEGLWRCNGCWRPAQLRLDAPECHRCRDWTPCGMQCTLRELSCAECGTTLAISYEAEKAADD